MPYTYSTYMIKLMMEGAEEEERREGEGERMKEEEKKMHPNLLLHLTGQSYS